MDPERRTAHYSAAPFAYDAVLYDTKATEDAHPQVLHVLGALFGLSPATPSEARVLEVGCGDGENLLAMAAHWPKARFAGYDLSQVAVARGQATIAALGLENAALEVRSITDGAPEGGPFDYVIAHGVYSWVPDGVKEALLARVRESLAPEGVAFVSFNAMPGWSLARALRAVLLEATAHLDDPRARVGAALRAARALADTAGGEGTFAALLSRHAAWYVDDLLPPWVPEGTFVPFVFHDTLAACNDPVSPMELARRGARHGLRYVAESPLLTGRADGFAAARAWLGDTDDAEGLVACATLLEGPPFVGALLCRDDAPAVSVAPDLAPLRRSFFHIVGTPGTMGFADAARLVGADPAGPDEGRAAAEALLRRAVQRRARIYAEAAPGVTAVSACPRASPLVRLRAEEALAARRPFAPMITATHFNISMMPFDLAILAELDGTRSLAEVASRLRQRIALGAVPVPKRLEGIQDAKAGVLEGLVGELVAAHGALGLLLG